MAEAGRIPMLVRDKDVPFTLGTSDIETSTFQPPKGSNFVIDCMLNYWHYF